MLTRSLQYSVENINNSYGHNEEYEQSYPLDPNHNYQQDYAINPQAHHDQYYNPPYQPSPHEEHPLTHFPSNPADPYYDHDEDKIPAMALTLILLQDIQTMMELMVLSRQRHQLPRSSVIRL